MPEKEEHPEDTEKMPDKVTYAEIYAGLWKCRDFELSHYWQRAVFLTAFLLTCYAGYGTFIVSAITSEHVRIPAPIINIIAFSICVVGLVLSFLWIIMAKGSKAWYERYESAITAFVKKYGDDAFEDGLKEVAGFEIVNIKEFKVAPISNWIWTPYGGAYSVSKINIAIGHISVLIWAGLIVVHLTLAKMKLYTVADLGRLTDFLCNADNMFVLGCIVLLLFWLYVHVMLKSSCLEEYS